MTRVDSEFRHSAFLESNVRSTSPEMSELIARTDWSRTPLGAPEGWPDALHTALGMVLTNRFPTVFWWGPELVQFYNDPYRPMLGAKHPQSLGQSAKVCWHEIWDVIGPLIEQVYRGGPSTWNEDLLLDVNRHGFIEETYFTFSYSPLPDPAAPGGIGGVLGTVQESSQKVIGERRIMLLRDLAARGTEALTVEDECRLAMATLERYSTSVPFALIYLASEDGSTATLGASFGIAPGEADTPAAIDLSDPDAMPWPLARVRTSGTVLLDDLVPRLEHLPPGPWPEPPRSAVILPIPASASSEPAGYLVAGVNARLPFDERYESFYKLVASQLGSAIGSARAYEAERKRAEALAEIDRAKNIFFSNVSHEFRTPLTLMLGPLEELARTADSDASMLVETAHRNALRLLKLVNTLLEFSRLEAGRNDAAFVRTDVANLTRELCGLFRSAIESTGLTFDVEIRTDAQPYIDRSMWEKILLNLLSNALKFTLDGGIRVSLTSDGEAIELTVADTGIGIPEQELPHLFERFRRVRGAKARSHEGSGIGLALVEELVHLHGGIIAAESAVGSGTAFRVRIPLGIAHLDQAKIVSDPGATMELSVAEQYLADLDATVTRADAVFNAVPAHGNGVRARILVADDNADLREYVARLLSPAYDVITVRDGAEALRELKQRHFDFVISDVMMPQMDGFELLRRVRADKDLEKLPFMLLSARAGEEAAVEGLERGADDYLAKPFSSHDLLARVYAHLNASVIREQAMQEVRASEQRFRSLAESMPHIVFEANAAGAIGFLSEAYSAFTGHAGADGLGMGWTSSIHVDDVANVIRHWNAACEAGEPFAYEFRMRRFDGTYRWHIARALPQRAESGAITGWTGTITDIHDAKRATLEREFLAGASRIFSESLELQTTLQSIAQLVVPQFADWCRIDLNGSENRVETVAIAHRDPAKHAIAQQFVGRPHLNALARYGSAYAARTGESQLLDVVLPEFGHEIVPKDADLTVYRQMGIRSAAAIPLNADGKTLGAILVAYGDSGRKYAPEDLAMLEELGRRAGTAVQRANEFEREHRVAESFQEASLPMSLPDVPGISFDAIYIPGSAEAQVGGDWFDAVRLFDGRVVVSIGDVSGHGLHAAVTMGNMRQIIRGIAQVHADPALMLDAADRALRLEHPDEFVTAFVGVFDPVTGAFSYASAGHPPPMLRGPEGSVLLLGEGGLPLGLRRTSEESRGKTIFLAEGSQLVLYTDGLTEAARAPATGEDTLRSVIASGAPFNGDTPATAVAEVMLGEGQPKDDVAVLVITVGSADERLLRHWTFETADAQTGRSTRHAFAAVLREHHVGEEYVHAAEIVFGELVGNAARHAAGTIEVVLDWNGAAPVLHVLDDGPGVHHIPALPSDVYSESGRGLFIIAQLSEDFHVAKRPTGGSHARAVLRVSPR